MLQQVWVGECRKITVCVDSYDGDVLKGRYYNALREMEYFESFTQFLTGVEALLEDQQEPQSYTELRKFSPVVPSSGQPVLTRRIHRGKVATFEVQILFRQHSSWQGMVIWRDRKLEQPFRSVLELTLMMDSVLRSVRQMG